MCGGKWADVKEIRGRAPASLTGGVLDERPTQRMSLVCFLIRVQAVATSPWDFTGGSRPLSRPTCPAHSTGLILGRVTLIQ